MEVIIKNGKTIDEIKKYLFYLFYLSFFYQNCCNVIKSVRKILNIIILKLLPEMVTTPIYMFRFLCQYKRRNKFEHNDDMI